jgi:gluconokinase
VDREPQHLVVMGVAGSGKTTVATLLAARLGWTFAEADEFHPQANIDKMSAGIPLTDDDRWPWLEAMRDWLTSEADAGRSTVVTCSALKRAYRDVLRGAAGRVRFVHLAAPAAVIGDRLGHRSGHFMPVSLLPSQFETLQPLLSTEDGVTVDAEGSPDVVVDAALAALGLAADPSTTSAP